MARGRLRTETTEWIEWRQGKGVSLDQIAETTKIPVRYLQAIESGKLHTLPGGVYTTSYVRQYARAIHYNEEELMRHLLPGRVVEGGKHE